MRSRSAALLVVMVLAGAACGARLTSEQRTAGIQGGGTGGGSAVGDTGTAPGIGEAGQGPAAGTGTGIGAAPGSGPGALPSAPAGGNGGATDIGVTGTSVTIAVASDVSGVQPGLFKSTHQAMTALAAYVNSQGGVYGRALKPLLLDTKIDAVANKAAVAEACDKAFALVGSMSALDDGGAGEGERCGIPDISAITVNGARTLAKNVYPAYAVRPDLFMIGTANYIKEEFPQAVRKAAILWLNVGVTQVTSRQRMRALESVGFEFIYKQEVQALEANYTPFVLEMDDLGVEYVTMVGNYESIVRLMKAAFQQSWRPAVWDWDSVAYSAGFLKGGRPVEGSLVFLNTAIFEEAASNPEMQLYMRWLSRVAPGAKPDYFGLYAWSAGRLFVQAATAAGPQLTRRRVFDELRKIHAWNGFGIHAVHDIGNKMPTHCFLYVEVKGGTFVRRDPASGWMCNKGGLIRASG